jgi:hypothetical protein
MLDDDWRRQRCEAIRENHWQDLRMQLAAEVVEQSLAVSVITTINPALTTAPNRLSR